MELYYHSFYTAAGWIAVLSAGKGPVKNTLPQSSEEKALVLLGISKLDALLSPDRFEKLERQFNDYFKGYNVYFSDELDLSKATPFQLEVWQTARLIPYGETRSYLWVANKIGKPRASRAVGQALGRNPLPIIIPCHRVIGDNGKPVGYSGGLEVKLKLLGIEGINLY